MAIATATYIYGPIPKSVPLPDWLQGDVNLGFRYFPSYRAFLIVLGTVLIAVLWYAFERTNIGAKIRAAVDNRRMWAKLEALSAGARLASKELWS